MASWDNPTGEEPEIPATAKTLGEACIRWARQSCRILTECWIDGSFPTFDYFFTQYLFSASIVLAISSLLGGRDARSDIEQFETASQLLSQLKDSGSFAGEEFCQHIKAMTELMAAAEARRRKITLPPVVQVGTPQQRSDAGNGSSTTGLALSEPSLQEFLSRPLLDLQFIDTSIYSNDFQGLYWPDMQSGEGKLDYMNFGSTV